MLFAPGAAGLVSGSGPGQAAARAVGYCFALVLPCQTPGTGLAGLRRAFLHESAPWKTAPKFQQICPNLVYLQASQLGRVKGFLILLSS